MIPSSLVGLVLFAACLGPGFVYVRVAEKRRARPERSALAEAVEMVSIGGLASAVAALVVLTAGDALGLLDASVLGRDPNEYLFDHPARLLGALILFLAVAYLGAAKAALLTHAEQDAVFEPGVTTWQQMFYWGRTTPEHGTAIVAELRDGRRVGGFLGPFTAEFDENRELALVKPISVAPKGGSLKETGDAFVVVRECDVLSISGRYWPPKEAAPSAGPRATQTT